MWLHVVSDLLIAGAYFAIPVVLLGILRRRRDVPFSRIFGLFGAFIVACGATHVMEVWNLWHAQYWLAGYIKGITAVASVAAAVVLASKAPQILRVPNLGAWAKANAELENRVSQRNLELSLANEELRESRERLRLAQRAGNIGTWERNLVTGETSWSSELEEMYGFKAGVHTRDVAFWRKFVHPDDVPAMDAAVAGAVRDGTPYFVEFRITRQDSEVRWISARGNLVRDAAGNPQRLVGVTIDITEQKRAAEEIRALNASLEARVAERTRELSNANKELESFSYSVSHDLRSPLRTIDGFSLALLEDCGERLDELGKGHLQRIRSAAQRMGLLIDDLLNLSRVSRAQLSVQTFDLSAVVSAVAQELQATHLERTVDWRVQPQVSATGDARLLKVVMENLLNNAWKFTSKRGAACIEFGVTEKQGSPAYFVKDDGAGFDPAYADRLFGAFQRLHGVADFPGTGIGLATVQRVIRRHGGQVWAESAVGQGATFYFTLAREESNGAKA